MAQKGFTPVLILVGIIVAATIAGGTYYFLKVKAPAQKACTQEAKICPDGSSVGRAGPNCEFSPCPTLSPRPTSTNTITASRGIKEKLCAGGQFMSVYECDQGVYSRPPLGPGPGTGYFDSQGILIEVCGGSDLKRKDPEKCPSLTSLKCNSENICKREAPKDNETANWKTYITTKHGFSIKYPTERILGDEPKAADSEILSSRSVYIQEKDNFNSGTVDISVYSDGAGSIESWEGLAGIKATNIAVGQELAKTVEWIDKTASGKSLYNQKIVIKKNNFNYVISSNIYNDSTQKEEFLKVFNRMLSTFKFIP